MMRIFGSSFKSAAKVAANIVRSSLADIFKGSSLLMTSMGLFPILLAMLIGGEKQLRAFLGHNKALTELLVRALHAIGWTPSLALSFALALTVLRTESRAESWWRQGWRAAPRVLAATACMAVLTGTIDYIGRAVPPFSGAYVAVKNFIGLVDLYIVARTFIWIPTIVDRGLPVFASLRSAWSLGQRGMSLVLLLFAFFGIPMVLAGAALQRVPALQATFLCLMFPVLVLICCRTYNHLLNSA